MKPCPAQMLWAPLAARGEAPLPRGARRQPRRLPRRLATDEAAIR
jgi:hypothetical protein